MKPPTPSTVSPRTAASKFSGVTSNARYRLSMESSRNAKLWSLGERECFAGLPSRQYRVVVPEISVAITSSFEISVFASTKSISKKDRTVNDLQPGAALLILIAMESELIIKGKTIGGGKPLICVPIVEDTKDGVLSEFRSILSTNAEMIEWRADLFEKADDTELVLEILSRMQEAAGGKLLLFTYRSEKQGGNGRLSPAEIEILLKSVAEKKAADLIDVEYVTFPDPTRLIKSLRQDGAVVIASHHDFAVTPPEEAMTGILTDMRHAGADIVKLAVMPSNMDDVLLLLAVTGHFREEFPDTPIITMSMGRYGMLSRLCGEFFGIAVTFGSHSRASAPGQIELAELSILLQKIHKSYSEEGT